MSETINYVYDDTDTYQNEISEIYSYSEESEFFSNRNAFEESMEDCGLPLAWKHMVKEQKSRAINHLFSSLEVTCRATRIKSCRSLAYLIQGNFGECLTLEDQAKNSQENVFYLYEQNIFHLFVQQLVIEINHPTPSSELQRQGANAPTSQIFTDSSDLRLILSVLCTITETMYHAKDSTDPRIQELRQQFIEELQTPFDGELLSVTLFQMLNTFCGGFAPHFPVRKITLLLWKVLLLSLGGTDTLRELKDTYRKRINLPPQTDDTVEVTKNMRPCSPPLASNGQSKLKVTLAGSGSVAGKRKVFKQPAFDDAIYAYATKSFSEIPSQKTDEDSPDQETNEIQNELNESMDINELDEKSNCKIQEIVDETVKLGIDQSQEITSNEVDSQDSGISSESPSSDKRPPYNDGDLDYINHLNYIFDQQPSDSSNPSDELMWANGSQWGKEIDRPNSSASSSSAQKKSLPWAPKVRRADLNLHLSNLRQKFLGFSLPNEFEIMVGLPGPIIEGVNVLRKHLYISLADAQLAREDLLEKYPITYNELNPEFRETPTEKLYSALLPRMPQYVIALLKILLAASTATKTKTEKTESINIMSEMDPDNDDGSIFQNMKVNADASRHKEVIIKAVSATLILLLKHLKINHIYQFEYVSQQMMFANCIPLVLKFLSQDVYTFIMDPKSTISMIDFPACVIGEPPALTTLPIQLCSFQPFSRRNMFSCINMVRILNKIVKWKHSRVMMLVVFKSTPTLMKALNIRQPLFQVNVLKLLKMQLKFMGRPWKKSNMKLISAIYQKVRHRLTDDWAYSNDNEAKPWNFQSEEFALQSSIHKFHQRRYQNILIPNKKSRGSVVLNPVSKLHPEDIADADTDMDLDYFESVQISPQFSKNYERWLESEVFQRKIDWDSLMES